MLFHNHMVDNTTAILRSPLCPSLAAAFDSGDCIRISKTIQHLLSTGEHLHTEQTAVGFPLFIFQASDCLT